MGKFDLYKVSLKGIQPDIQELDFDLDQAFFQAIDSPEVSKGVFHVHVLIKNKPDRFEFVFDINGYALVPCDRCLDDLKIQVSTKETLYVKFGEESADDGDNVVVIPEHEGVINIAWFLFEFIALQIPIKHVHPTGECNKPMLSKLRKFRVVDENDSEESEEEPFDDEESDDIENVDPRWEKLKNIIDNN
ncbi:MAG: DUF177 domain-containing protein [Bacteroidales bacterium]|nr:DUF177 domain-containing protein [Bacteroidales bacterium]